MVGPRKTDWKTCNVPKNGLQRLKYSNLCAKSIGDGIVRSSKKTRIIDWPTNINPGAARKSYVRNDEVNYKWISNSKVGFRCLLCEKSFSFKVPFNENQLSWYHSLNPYLSICSNCNFNENIFS